MNVHMKGLKLAFCLLATLSLLLTFNLPVIAEPSPQQASASPQVASPPLYGDDEELQRILQSSLSIVEIDKEILRIQERELTLQEQIVDTELLLYDQEIEIEEKRVAAGQVLAAYYKGERSGIYLSLLKVDSFQQFLLSFELIEYIFRKDRQALTAYVEHYEELRGLYEQHAAEQVQLQEIKQQLEQQRERVLALEQQIDEELSGRSDAERVELLIKQLTSYWQEEGLQQVKTYFNVLAQAMNELPKWLQKNKEYISSKGFNYTIALPQDALNHYLRDYDPMFEAFEFQFQDGFITAKGQNDKMTIEITGRYDVVNEPSNYISFTIDELHFNGFLLPDTTSEQLMQQFDLNFYPGAILKMLRASSVEVADELLTIKLKLSL